MPTLNLELKLFNLGISEIALIAVIALIFIGPKQLPEIARALGRALNELKRASEDLTSSITNPRNYSDSSHSTHTEHQTMPSSHEPTTGDTQPNSDITHDPHDIHTEKQILSDSHLHTDEHKGSAESGSPIDKKKDEGTPT